MPRAIPETQYPAALAAQNKQKQFDNSFLGKTKTAVTNFAKGAVKNTFKVLNAPQAAVEKVVTGGQGWKPFYESKGLSPTQSSVAAFGSSVIADPLNFVGLGGVSKLAKVAEGAKVVSGLGKVTKVADKVNEGRKFIKASVPFTNIEKPLIGLPNLGEIGSAASKIPGVSSVASKLEPITEWGKQSFKYGYVPKAKTNVQEQLAEGLAKLGKSPKAALKYTAKVDQEFGQEAGKRFYTRKEEASGAIQKGLETARDLSTPLRTATKELVDALPEGEAARLGIVEGKSIPFQVQSAISRILTTKPEELQRTIQGLGKITNVFDQPTTIETATDLYSRSLENISRGSAEVLARHAEPVRQAFSQLKDEMVLHGMAPEEAFSRFQDAYLPLIKESGLDKIISTAGGGAKTGRLIQRTSDPLTEAMARVETGAAFPAAVGLGEERRFIEVNKFFKTIKDDFSVPVKLDGYVQVPTDKRFGPLASSQFHRQYIPNYVYDEITKGTQAMVKYQGDFPEPLTKFMDWYKKGLQAWKTSKVVINPPTIARNFMSNQVLIWLATGGKGIKELPAALNEFARKGNFYKEAAEAGLFRGTQSASEFNSLIPEYRKFFDLADNSLTSAIKGNATKMRDLYDASMTKATKLYGGIENIGKMQVYMAGRNAGMAVDDALQLAEKTLFEYHKITSFEKGLRDNFIPFYTFTRKAIPEVTQSILNTPRRALAIERTKELSEDVSEDKFGKVDPRMLPSYLQDKTQFTRVPIKGKDGRPTYINTGALLPFQNIQNPTKLAPTSESVLPAGMGLTPGITLPLSFIQQKDTFGRDITRPGMSTGQKIGANVSYFAKALSPSGVFPGIPRAIKAVTGIPAPELLGDYVADSKPTSIPEAILDNFLGINFYEPKLDISNYRNQINKIKSDTKTEVNRALRSSMSADYKRKAVETATKTGQDRLKNLVETTSR